MAAVAAAWRRGLAPRLRCVAGEGRGAEVERLLASLRLPALDERRGRSRTRSRGRRGRSRSSSSSSASSCSSVRAAADRPPARGRALEEADVRLLRAAARYRPLARCLERFDHLRKRPRRHRKAQRWLEQLIFRLEVPPGLTGRPSAVRFVALSDTHREHGVVDLPPGEVLLFVGDAVGNYGRNYDLAEHFDKFLAWLAVQSARYAKVFFIAGNHETLLDDQQGDASVGLSMLEKFLKAAPNCTYLNNEAAEYRGLRMWASPVTVSRLENEGKRYYSRAFERFSEQRARLWAEVPEGLDLLMTHCPPWGPLCSKDVGDPRLAERLAQMKAPPKVHVFGHDHCFLGVRSDGRTISLNVAQDESLRVDPHGGGCALFFDLEPPNGSA